MRTGLCYSSPRFGSGSEKAALSALRNMTDRTDARGIAQIPRFGGFSTALPNSCHYAGVGLSKAPRPCNGGQCLPNVVLLTRSSLNHAAVSN